MKKLFKIYADYQPAGDQPAAIQSLVAGIDANIAQQILLGVTGSGKTFTIAQVIAALQKPALIMAPNKTLAAQLYGEFKTFFPENAVEYFVSYYDYYQPEAYVPSSDTYIAKDASINKHIEQMRLSATKALIEREDSIIVATVSAIYGLGDPDTYLAMVLHLSKGEHIEQQKILKKLAEMQYTRNQYVLERGQFRVHGDVIDLFPADSETDAIRIELFADEVDNIVRFDPLTGKLLQRLPRITIFPKTHYVTPRARILATVEAVKAELHQQSQFLLQQHKLVEEQRLRERTTYDLEMMLELGFCSGIENYSRYLSQRDPGTPPPTLFDYLPANALLVIDESHITIPQIAGMYRGDRSRKETLVNYGFRLPSALDNRPLRFEEFRERAPPTIYVSATPGAYEEKHALNIAEQLVRPTGLLDPKVLIRPAKNQVDDLLSEIHKEVAQGNRVLVTTLTKRMAEDLTEYLQSFGLKARYLHADLDTIERVEVIRTFRLGEYDTLVGINLLREGLDLPEVGLVAICDADKEGFLRSDKSLIQTVGRAARNINGRAILYADTITGSIQRALDEMQRRRIKQQEFNLQHNIKPAGIKKMVCDIMDGAYSSRLNTKTIQQTIFKPESPEKLVKQIKKLEKQMYMHAENMEFEVAAKIRDQLLALKEQLKFS